MQVYSADWVLPVSGPPIAGGGVAVRDGRIVAVGLAAELDGERRDEAGGVIVPGFVNAHTHLEYAVYAGFGDGLEFGDWLRVHVERKRLLDWEATVAIARAGAAACLAGGVTTAADASFSGAAAVAADELGLRAIVHLEVFGADAGELSTRFERNRERIERCLSPRVRLGVSPHAPATASTELYVASLALGLPVATHLAESPAERDWLVHGTGPWAAFAELLPPPPGETGIRMLARAGALSPAVSAAHCVHVDDEEIELLACHGVSVVHCPRSNALLGCGIAPLRRLREAGLRVGLGTDSPASTPSFDVFEEMRAAILLARAGSGRAGALSAAEALRLATLGSAEALGLSAELGSLEPGKRADLAVVSLAGSPYLPWEDPVSAVVYGGTPERVCRTIVDGVVRYDRGGTQWHELRARAAAARGRMLAPGSRR
ncbi:MAG: amidohydrolase family protein [Thermoleophilia bacterium]|nr:amidohydrolase family protein [Thermoleophilia bacterium]